MFSNLEMKPNKLIEQIETLIEKIKEQNVEFGLYLETHFVLDRERNIVYYFGKKLGEIGDLPISISN